MIDPDPQNQSVDPHGNRIGRIDPRFPLGIQIGNNGDRAQPYTYPDFTGYVGRLAALHGEWTVIHDGTMANAKWGTVSWNTTGVDCPADPEPGYTSLRVLVRAANTSNELADTMDNQVNHPWRQVQNNMPFYGTYGRYIQIKVVFAGRLTCDGYLTPTLCDLSVKPFYDITKDCDADGIPDECEILTEGDCNHNGLPDSCDLPPINPGNDCDSDGTPDDCQTGTLYVGTNGGTMESVNGPAKVWKAKGKVWTDLTPEGNGLGDSNVVRAIASYRGDIYTGAQVGTSSSTGGHVWRYHGGLWQQVDDSGMDQPVTVLVSYADQLYAATKQGVLWRARLADGSDWEQAGIAPDIEFRTATVGMYCGDTVESVYLGAQNSGELWRYDPARGLVKLPPKANVSIQDFASADTSLYAATLSQSTQAVKLDSSCTFTSLPGLPTPPQQVAGWSAETFGGELYLGAAPSGCVAQCACGDCLHCGDADMLWKYNGSSWVPVGHWPVQMNGGGVSALAAQANLALFIGLGQPSFEENSGSGKAEVWRYNGTDPPERISPEGFTGSGVQTMLLVGGDSPDCDGNGCPDAYEIQHGMTDECRGGPNGIPDICEPKYCNNDQDGDGIPDDGDLPECLGGNTYNCRDNCPTVPNPGQETINGYGIACHHALFDYDNDGDVDQTDYSVFQACFSGASELGVLTEDDLRCREQADANCDRKVDLIDLDLFIQAVSGPDIPAQYGLFDCNGNGRFDLCDIRCGEEQDVNPQNGIPDSCDAHGVGLPDADSDGVYDWLDNCRYAANADQADSDSDGVGDACDNCPSVYNLTQIDTDLDGTGDACEDIDQDGVADGLDNCPTVANPGQQDTDGDGIGNACDNCINNVNADQADADSDGVGDVCDNCPNVANTDQANYDLDAYGDACDADIDGDEIANEEDNCPTMFNPEQVDENENGIGDDCEELEGGQNRMALGSFLETDLGTTASFVLHDTGESSVMVSPGGTVVVDLVINSSMPILGFTAQPALSAPGVVSIDATGWNERDNVLVSLGQPGISLPSSYHFETLEWDVAYPDLQTLINGPAGTPGVGLERGRVLTQVTGPHAGEVLGIVNPISALAGLVNAQSGSVYTAAGSLGGIVPTPYPSGQLVVATLTLNITGSAGTYTLGVTDSTCFLDGDTDPSPMTSGTLFTITVQGQ